MFTKPQEQECSRMASEEEAGFVVVAELNSTYTGCSLAEDSRPRPVP